MAKTRMTILNAFRDEAGGYLGASLADFYSLPGHRLMIYAVAFILMGLGVFAALAFYDISNPLISIPLKFMGMNAWHTAAGFVVCTVLVDVLAALVIPTWGAYARRTVGKTWIIFFAGYLVGLICERMFAYKLIGLYEPGLVWLWESYPSQRAGALPMFFFTLPFWLVITGALMRIITRKQAQTEELLRVRIDAILEERTHMLKICPELAARTAAATNTAPDDPLQLPTDAGVGPIRASDIGHVTAEDHYLRIHYDNGHGPGNTLIRMPLKELSARLPHDRFIRIHRSHLINLHKISRLKRSGQTVKLLMKHGDYELPVSRYRLPELLPLLEKFLKP